MHIKRVILDNIRCFKHVEVDFEENNEPVLWSTLLGDNSAGKTTFLRSLAIGLCDQSSGAGLLRESEEGYIRRGQEIGKITLTLSSDDKAKSETTLVSTITNINTQKDPIEELSQEISGHNTRPWDRIFACAYGIGRGTSGSGDLGAYNTISAVYNLFNYGEGLQNPELVLLRCMQGKRANLYQDSIKPLLLRILPDIKDLHLEMDGIKVDGPWGDRMPLTDLADGYRSTCLWVLDFVGWAVLRAVQSASELRTDGIVLLDAIEEHLHPKWQRSIVQDLRKAFPKTQFIVSTHSPLVAGNSTMIYDDELDTKLFHFHRPSEARSAVTISEISEDFDELGCDQILGSEAFEHTSSESSQIQEILARASHLASRTDRSPEDDEKLKRFKAKLKAKMFYRGRSSIERIVEREYYDTLNAEVDEFRKLMESDSDDKDTTG